MGDKPHLINLLKRFMGLHVILVTCASFLAAWMLGASPAKALTVATIAYSSTVFHLVAIIIRVGVFILCVLTLTALFGATDVQRVASKNSGPKT
ncbi:hypothetical protein AB8B21_33130 [Tardiphaga sp. 866_E4_N2_1]|uniref:hypothetical protein n=1 Tax=unclassified Tardiphaga TaxID=2631404 RepID=UPI003F290414